MQIDIGPTFGDFNSALKVITRISGKPKDIGHVSLVQKVLERLQKLIVLRVRRLIGNFICLIVPRVVKLIRTEIAILGKDPVAWLDAR